VEWTRIVDPCLSCRICFDGESSDEASTNPLISPCLCSGSSSYVHRQVRALQRGLASCSTVKFCCVSFPFPFPHLSNVKQIYASSATWIKLLRTSCSASKSGEKPRSSPQGLMPFTDVRSVLCIPNVCFDHFQLQAFLSARGLQGDVISCVARSWISRSTWQAQCGACACRCAIMNISTKGLMVLQSLHTQPLLLVG